MENKTLEERFIQELRNSNKDNSFVYYNLFSILFLGDPNFLKQIVEDYEKYFDEEKYDGEWFRLFHKVFRQCDWFSDDICFVQKRITEKEMEEREVILKYRQETRKKFPDDAEVIDDEYHALTPRLRELNTRMQTYKKHEENISGHLDSIMWQTIANDENGTLYKIMKQFLKENVNVPSKPNV